MLQMISSPFAYTQVLWTCTIAIIDVTQNGIRTGEWSKKPNRCAEPT